jgi:valyl-tRNA synthetase
MKLWWGHRIPAYYVDGSKSEYIVARNIAEAQEKAKAKYNREVLLTQDDDVLDTWFRFVHVFVSSALFSLDSAVIKRSNLNHDRIIRSITAKAYRKWEEHYCTVRSSSQSTTLIALCTT